MKRKTRVYYKSSKRKTVSDYHSAAYRKHKSTKKMEYGQRVCEVEHGVFTTLVFSTTDEMATTIYRRLADGIFLN